VPGAADHSSDLVLARDVVAPQAMSRFRSLDPGRLELTTSCRTCAPCARGAGVLGLRAAGRHSHLDHHRGRTIGDNDSAS
jgi:hypothetical protein